MEIFADFAQYPPPMTDTRNPLVGAAVPTVNAYHCPPPPVASEPEMIQYDYTKPRDYPKHQYLFPYSQYPSKVSSPTIKGTVQAKAEPISTTGPPSPGCKSEIKPKVEQILRNDHVDLEALIEASKKTSRRGRKRKSSEEEELQTLECEAETDAYRKKRIRNNIAVRKSRERAKLRLEGTQKKLIELHTETQTQKELIIHMQQQCMEWETKASRAERRLEETLKFNVRMRQFINNLPTEMQPCFAV
ncbi:unnamed protein product [Oikopleura dioica]|uniref:BZIP domain-containing protein n=1 Tax=Oikopleura dioica TaxID=34765 RepID=E4WUP2_OIKDI|nr:unnamed protein product [Oikopleura dioica]